LPANVALHETVAVPDPVRLVGLIVPQVRPDGTVSLRVTVPPKWFSDVIVTFDVADTPTLTATGEEAVIVKSRNWKSAVAVWMREPLVPVIVRV
jgi:hypothetical protein